MIGKNACAYTDPLGPARLHKLFLQKSLKSFKKRIQGQADVAPFWLCLLTAIKAFEKRRLICDREYLDALTSWNKTEIATIQHQMSLSLIMDVCARTARQYIELYDFGTGDGKLMAQIIGSLRQSRNVKCKVFLFDIRKGCLDKSAEAIKRCSSDAVQIVTSLMNVKSVNPPSFLMPGRRREFAIALFSSCLHEVSNRCRLDIIRRWFSVADAICISELEGNHDAPAWGSFPYACSVWRFYNLAITEILASDVIEKRMKRRCIETLLMPELVKIALGESGAIDRHFREADLLRDLRNITGIEATSRGAVSAKGLKAFAALMTH